MVARNGHVVEKDAVGGLATQGDDVGSELKDRTGMRPLHDGKRRISWTPAAHEVWDSRVGRRHTKDLGRTHCVVAGLHVFSPPIACAHI